jgi:prepilin-type N-terminal cleavage/methylation domain-containing protein
MTVRSSRQLPPANVHGFTLRELLIAVAIILTLVEVAKPNRMAAAKVAKIARVVGDIYTLEDEITLDEAIKGRPNIDRGSELLAPTLRDQENCASPAETLPRPVASLLR